MSKKFPLDEFDQLPDHGGRHRIRRTAVDRVREFIRYTAMATILAGAVFFALTWADSGNIFSGSVPVATSTVDPIKSLPVTVLDSTDEDGRAGSIAHKVLDAGWTVVTAANTDENFDESVIYYSNVDYRAAAVELAKVVGDFKLELSIEQTDPLTVVLGPNS